MRNGSHPHASVAAMAGFTLLEMLVVLAVLGLLSAVALPPLRLNEGTRLREIAHALAVDLRLARLEATRRGVSTAVVPAASAYLVQPSGRTKYLPSGVTFTAEVAETGLVPDVDSVIRFFPDGSSTGGTVAVQQGSMAIHLTIRGLDGKVRLDER